MNCKRLLLAGVAALTVALTGCQKRDINGGETPQPEGTTYMSVSIRNLVPEMNKLKAEDTSFNSKGEWVGRDDIKQVKVYIVDDENGTISNHVVTPKTGTTHSVNSADNKISDFEAWKTTPGNKTVYVLINGVGTAYETALNGATAANFATEYAKVVTMTATDNVDPAYGKLEAGKDVIVMTGAPATVNVVRGVTKAQAEAGQNTAKLEVRRALAQAVVTYEQNKTFEIKVDNKVIATLTDLTWAGAQMEKTQKGYEEKYLVGDVKTPSFDYIPTATTFYGPGNAMDNYVYGGLVNFKTVNAFSRATGTDAATIMPQLLGQDFAQDNSIYLTETTHKMGGLLVADGGTAGNETGYRKGNTPYFIVRAKITPAADAWAAGENATRSLLRQNIAQNDPALRGDIHYYGGKFYKNLDKAHKAAGYTVGGDTQPGVEPMDKVITYKGGYCYYIYWYNPQNMAVNGVEKPVNSPIIRNNLYHVNITGFVKLGLTGNPLNPDPQNPLTPDPDDPNGPKPEEPLYDTDTFMNVEINIVPWGVHSFDHSF